MPQWFHALSWVVIALGLLSCAWIVFDLPRRQPQPMAVMNLVWPINALWGGPLMLWAYRLVGRRPARTKRDAPQEMSGMDMSNKAEHDRPFWQAIIGATLHCGSGCTVADLIGPFVFRALPFAVAGSMVFGEWTLDYILALIIGVTFQYAALSPMLGQSGLPIWWRALKVDFWSLSAWQVGMYGWMALVIFVWFGRIEPSHIEFWFLMQVAMACGFLTSYPMNWFLVRIGIKTAM